MNISTKWYVTLLSLTSTPFLLIFISLFLLPEIEESDIFTFYSYGYWLIPFVGSIIGYFAAHKWGGVNSLTGKAILCLSGGLLFQSIGQLLYSFQVLILLVENPYPSVAEIFFVGSIPLYIVGAFLIGKISGLENNIKSLPFRLVSITVFIMMLAFAYAQFLNVHDPENISNLLLFLEIVYPIGQGVFVSTILLAFMLNKNLRGGTMVFKIFILLVGLLSQYFADTFYDKVPVKMSDFLYIYSYFMLSFGLILFNEIKIPGFKNNSENSSQPLIKQDAR